MRERVLRYIRDQGLLQAGDRVGVAVSGGPDSVALLRVLLELRGELGIVLAAVVHFNHRLRGPESDADEHFVRRLAEEFGLEFRRGEGDTAAHAAAAGDGLEAAARALRYDCFTELARAHALDAIATGHTLDDQAETVLMRLVRGAGTRGLAAIVPRQRVEQPPGKGTSIVRPLLGVRRREVAAYLRALGQDSREDASNRDPKFLRNRVRHELLPLLERDYNPRVAEALAQTAEIARAEQQYWERELSEAMRRSVRWKAAPGSGRGLLLALAEFERLPLALQRQLLQRACERLGVTPTFEQVEAMLAAPGSGAVALPGGLTATRSGSELRLWVAEGTKPEPAAYEYRLAVPGEVEVRELGSRIVVTKDRKTASKGALDAATTAGGLVVRNWRPGDRFQPRHARSAKKVKELLTGKKISGRERALWPVVAAGERVVWLRGWGVAADAVAGVGAEGVGIEEVRTAE